MHGLDTLRSLAILSVIVFHIRGYGGTDKLPAWLAPLSAYGWMGVDLFFVLSGFLIGSQLFRPYRNGKPASICSFYRNRFYRILPAYFVVLALYLAVPHWREAGLLSPVWEYCTFTLNLFIDYAHADAFSHAWSLCVEEHFYLLLPLIASLLMCKPSQRRTVIVLTALVFFGIAVRGFILFHWLQPMSRTDGPTAMFYLEHIYYPTYSRLDGLIAGVALALIRTFRPHWWQALARRGHSATVLALVLIVLSGWLFRDRFESFTGSGAVGTLIGFPILAAGFALLTASAMSTNGILSRIKVPGATLIATLAYSLYLTQKEVIHLTTGWFPQLASHGSIFWCAGYAVCALSVAAALHLCVERPFLLLRDRHRRLEPAIAPIPSELVPQERG